MTPSIAVLYKFHDLFPKLVFEAAFSRAGRATKKDRAKIRRQCPTWGSRSPEERGSYWLVDRQENIVFVVAFGKQQFVVDVFPLTGEFRAKSAAPP